MKFASVLGIFVLLVLVNCVLSQNQGAGIPTTQNANDLLSAVINVSLSTSPSQIFVNQQAALSLAVTRVLSTTTTPVNYADLVIVDGASMVVNIVSADGTVWGKVNPENFFATSSTSSPPSQMLVQGIYPVTFFFPLSGMYYITVNFTTQASVLGTSTSFSQTLPLTVYGSPSQSTSFVSNFSKQQNVLLQNYNVQRGVLTNPVSSSNSIAGTTTAGAYYTVTMSLNGGARVNRMFCVPFYATVTNGITGLAVTTLTPYQYAIARIYIVNPNGSVTMFKANAFGGSAVTTPNQSPTDMINQCTANNNFSADGLPSIYGPTIASGLTFQYSGINTIIAVFENSGTGIIVASTTVNVDDSKANAFGIYVGVFIIIPVFLVACVFVYVASQMKVAKAIKKND